MDKIRLGKYRHYKGNYYMVLGVAKHSETMEDFVVYMGLYEHPELGRHPLFIRPLGMFLEDVEVNGKIMPRFEFIDDKV